MSTQPHNDIVNPPNLACTNCGKLFTQKTHMYRHRKYYCHKVENITTQNHEKIKLITVQHNVISNVTEETNIINSPTSTMKDTQSNLLIHVKKDDHSDPLIDNQRTTFNQTTDQETKKDVIQQLQEKLTELVENQKQAQVMMIEKLNEISQHVMKLVNLVNDHKQ